MVLIFTCGFDTIGGLQPIPWDSETNILAGVLEVNKILNKRSKWDYFVKVPWTWPPWRNVETIYIGFFHKPPWINDVIITLASISIWKVIYIYRTRKRCLPRYQNTKKCVEKRGRRPSFLTTSKCFETVVKNYFEFFI